MSLWDQLVQMEFIKNRDLIYYQEKPKCLVSYKLVILLLLLLNLFIFGCVVD